MGGGAKKPKFIYGKMNNLIVFANTFINNLSGLTINVVSLLLSLCFMILAKIKHSPDITITPHYSSIG